MSNKDNDIKLKSSAAYGIPADNNPRSQILSLFIKLGFAVEQIDPAVSVRANTSGDVSSLIHHYHLPKPKTLTGGKQTGFIITWTEEAYSALLSRLQRLYREYEKTVVKRNTFEQFSPEELEAINSANNELDLRNLVDAPIYHLVKSLNELDGVTTTFSCSGHTGISSSRGYIMLVGHRLTELLLSLTELIAEVSGELKLSPNNLQLKYNVGPYLNGEARKTTPRLVIEVCGGAFERIEIYKTLLEKIWDKDLHTLYNNYSFIDKLPTTRN